MDDSAKLVSKVLVLDGNPESFDRIKEFCDANDLIGLKAHERNLMSILKSNVDMGAILLSEDFGKGAGSGIALAREIHLVRAELPIVLRREHRDSLDDLPEKDRKLFCAAYTLDNVAKLRGVIDEFIFSRVYPNVLVRGIKEISEAALTSQFKSAEIGSEPPYIVRDRMIYGEVFSLIPLESSWCRGYMMLQTDEITMLNVTGSEVGGNDFRSINSALSEVTNLIWGAFKNRYIDGQEKRGEFLTQVPIIINHQHRYISFGSEDPQLCFKYTLVDKDDDNVQPMVIYQRFVFNLNWSPDDFKEVQASVEELVDSGELELF